jgi:hypothetical protein
MKNSEGASPASLHEAHFVTDAIEPYLVNAAWIRARW